LLKLLKYDKSKRILAQRKNIERYGGVPSDEWLNSPKVYNSKKRHLEVLGLLKVKPKKYLILDAGCGPATYGLILSEQREYTVIGVDISKAAVRKAHDRAAKRKSFWLVEADLEFLPFRTESFDIVFIGWTLHHFPSIKLVCKDLYRCLKTGGKIAIVEPNEKNLVMRLSRFIESIFGAIILKIGWDTPNRTIYTYEGYIQELKMLGFAEFELQSCYVNLPPIPISSPKLVKMIMGLTYQLRVFLFKLGTKVLSPPLNGPELLISAIKGKEE
jgi:ubiquinone/menaquinone biosynthesis C-methylase UbiE